MEKKQLLANKRQTCRSLMTSKHLPQSQIWSGIIGGVDSTIHRRKGGSRPNSSQDSLSGLNEHRTYEITHEVTLEHVHEYSQLDLLTF